MDFLNAKRFIQRNARPLDLARFEFFFCGGSKEKVIECLKAYQNPDGGFGHGLELDCWNPNSTPIQTWKAMSLLEEIGYDVPESPLIQGIISYLSKYDGFNKDKDQWEFASVSNNDYPHAIWWEYNDKAPFRFNPSAYIAAFIIKYANKDSEIFEHAKSIIKASYDFICSNDLSDSKDTLSCYVGMYEILRDIKANDIINLDSLKNILNNMVNKSICKDKSQYGIKYVAVPSDYINSYSSPFIQDNREYINYEIDSYSISQASDGSFDICWKWFTDYPAQFEIARNYWKAEITINKLRFSVMMDTVLETDRLMLRKFNPFDTLLLVPIFSDPVMMQYYPAPFNFAKCEKWVNWNIKNYSKYGFGLFAVIEKSSNELLGDCGITMQNIDGKQLPELGFHISRSHQRKGFAFEAAQKVLNYAFDNLNLSEIYCYQNTKNIPSKTLAMKLGMSFIKEYLEPSVQITSVYALKKN